MKWLTLLLALLGLQPAGAIERIRIQAAALEATDIKLNHVQANLQIHTATRSTLELRATRVQLPAQIAAQTGLLRDLQISCVNPLVREPQFACPQLRMQVQTSSPQWPKILVTGEGSWRSDTGAFIAQGSGSPIAGAPLQFQATGDTTRMRAQASLRGLQIDALRTLLAPHVQLPADIEATGVGDLEAVLVRETARSTLDANLTVRGAGFQNSDYTWIGEKLQFTLQGSVELSATPITFALLANAANGQALAGPVLLDFDKNPLTLRVTGNHAATGLQITELRSEQRDLATVVGTAALRLAPFSVAEAYVQVTDIRFPAAYTSYLQLLLATTPFNQLTTSGNAELQLQLRDNQPTQLVARIRDLAFSDSSRALQVTGVSSELHWNAGLTGPPRPSWLAWESSRGWGIVGDRTRLDFMAQDRDLRLIKPARLPFFDGALLINTLAIERAGEPTMSGVFDAVIEPISVAPIAKATGMPEFAGKLSGRIPGLTYRDKVLSLQGNLEADVFDGRVVASNLRVREPLGAWPRLFGDIAARNLDLDLITRTFEFGSITGRLDIDLAGLETFNWSPVAFDLTLATPRNDRSRHRISQRAVQNLSDIGGGGGGVAAALQSGALRFFDDFGYDRIGLACRLRNDVCQMSGAGDAKGGFYIVKGSGLPRIDIIGNNRRVDWPRLVTQVADALGNPESIAVQ